MIISIGSILGREAFPFLCIHGASKKAVVALTESLWCEVPQLGVEVVEVQLSTDPTSLFASVQTLADTEVIESCGEVDRLPDAMFKA